MKTEGQARQKLKQVCYRHRKKLIEKSLSRVPGNCSHNRRLDSKGIQVGFCSLLIAEPEGWQGLVCDERRDPEIAKTCPKFQPAVTAEDAKAAFEALVEDPARGGLAHRYPDIAALLWVLDDIDVVHEIPDEMSVGDLGEDPEGECLPDDEDASEGKKKGLWARVWNRP